MTKTTRGLGCLILFALPFAAAGLLVTFLSAKMLWFWMEVRDWQEVPAQILNTELVTSTGDDSTTYEVEARYRYQFEGLTYEGNRVGLSAGSDNIGSFHQDKHSELSRFQTTGETFRCFVNPRAASEAVLYRELRWGLFALMGVFGILFTSVGIGLMIAGFWGKRRVEDEEKLVAHSPSEPWRWKTDWTDGRIVATGKAQFLLPCIMAVFWNLVSTPLLFLLPTEVLENDNYLALIGLVFPLVGFGLAIWAVRSFIRWKKFGDSVFEMFPFPGVIGGQVAGRILTSVDLKPANGFQIALSSINKVTRGSGDNRRTDERVLWQEEQNLQREAAQYDPTRSEIPIRFAVPYDAEPTNDEAADNEFLWRLQVDAEVPGVDYHASFDIPVFRTEDSRPEVEVQSDSSAWGVEEAPPVDLSRRGIEAELLSSGAWRLTFGAARHKGPATMLTLFMLLWLGFNYLLIHLDAPIFFPVIWGLFSLLIFIGVLDLWFERRTVVVHPDRLVLSGGLLGLGRSHEIHRSEIQEIAPVRGMQSGKKLFYRIQITTLDNKTHIAATKLENLSLARAVIDRLE